MNNTAKTHRYYDREITKPHDTGTLPTYAHRIHRPRKRAGLLCNTPQNLGH